MLYLLIDLPLAIEASQAPDSLRGFFRIATDLALGSTNFIIGFSLILLATVRRSHRLFALGLFIVVATAAAGLTVDVLKILFGRHRPSVFFTSGQYGLSFLELSAKQWSFPSGHAANAAALATALGYALPRGRACWVLIAVTLAASRVLVGAHFPSDAIAGAYVGTVITSSLRGWFPAALPPSPALARGPLQANGSPQVYVH
jgi:membrane-associated phospholipid phosphatase